MTTVLFECGVTEFDIMPKKENDEISFAINEKAMVINFMDSRKDNFAESILMHSEIEKRDAIRLAKLILFTYKMSENE
jgi:hypothetical protein